MVNVRSERSLVGVRGGLLLLLAVGALVLGACVPPPTPPDSDTISPVLFLPGGMSVEATSPEGATVTFETTAHDAVDGALPVSCTPASGSQFAVGVSVVTCESTDAAGNNSQGAFSITVSPFVPRAVEVAAGAQHSCALVEGGTVKCWGHNAFGQLGDGSNTNSNVPVDVAGLP